MTISAQKLKKILEVAKVSGVKRLELIDFNLKVEFFGTDPLPIFNPVKSPPKLDAPSDEEMLFWSTPQLPTPHTPHKEP